MELVTCPDCGVVIDITDFEELDDRSVSNKKEKRRHEYDKGWDIFCPVCNKRVVIYE